MTLRCLLFKTLRLFGFERRRIHLAVLGDRRRPSLREAGRMLDDEVEQFVQTIRRLREEKPKDSLKEWRG
jgi:hypothetical protein